jgi:hypothetical protein
MSYVHDVKDISTLCSLKYIEIILKEFMGVELGL